MSCAWDALSMLTVEQYIYERYVLEYRRHSKNKKASMMEERSFTWWRNGHEDYIPFREVRVNNNAITQWLLDNPEYIRGDIGDLLYVFVGNQNWQTVYMMHRKVGKWIS